MKTYYKIEEYNEKKEVGVQLLDTIYENKEQAEKDAKEMYNKLCQADKENGITYLIDIFENDEMIGSDNIEL